MNRSLLPSLFRCLWICGGLICAAGCTPPPSGKMESGPASSKGGWSFVDVTASSGVTARYENGRDAQQYVIPESLGGGVGLIDFDRDGTLDLVLPGGGTFVPGETPTITGAPLAFYRGTGSFHWRDVSSLAGVSAPRRYTHGTAIGDYDNDGFDDLAVTGYAGIDLWHNLGDGTFELLGESSGLHDDSWSSSAGWGDLDGDGNLDLFVAHYVNWSFANNPVCPSPSPNHEKDVCPPRKFEGLDDRVFRNLGTGEFEDQSAAWGIVPQGKGLGVLLADIDNDTDTDVYVANDTVNNFLYVNSGHGQADEVALVSGCAVDALGKPNGSMGVEFLDYNLDLTGDLWVTNFEQENACLYQGQGEHQYMDLARDTGIAAMGDLFVGFGTVARDFDGDGDPDIVVANGHVVYYPNKAYFEQQSILLENREGKRFHRAEVSTDSFFSKRYASRGVAAGDLDRNGTIDLVVTTLNGSPLVLNNQISPSGKRIRLKLAGTRANRSATGARIVLKSSAGERVGYLIGGGSYLSASEQVCDFFVPGDAGECSATIHWPYGASQTVVGLLPGSDFIIWEQPGSEAARSILMSSSEQN